MTKQNLRKQLALTLEIPEESILQYVRYGDHYSVITTTYQKFTDVYPAPDAEPVEAEEVLDKTGEFIEASDVTEDMISPLQPDFPPTLQLAWNNPRAARVTELRELVQGLGIEVTTKTKKADLVNKIIAYKLDYYG